MVSTTSAAPEPTYTKTKTQTQDDEDDEESTKTSTTSRSTPTSSPPSGGNVNALFPAGSSGPSWSTADSVDGNLPLSDGTLRPQNLMRALPHDYVTMAGKKAMKAHFPKGSYTFGHSPQGGLSFYAPGPSSVDLTEAKEATFGYSVYFPEGFDFQKGGKLPGLCEHQP